MLPHQEMVDRIRALTVQWRFQPVCSDDTDTWMEGTNGYSPNNEQAAINTAGLSTADRLVLELIDIGTEAAPAVAKGLRMQGRWREHLLPFAERYTEIPEIRAALELVARRKRDPVAFDAKIILGRLQG
jgi:hypothetical protein